jgi:hypothetical protein
MVAQQIKRFPIFYGIRRFITVVTRARHYTKEQLFAKGATFELSVACVNARLHLLTAVLLFILSTECIK